MESSLSHSASRVSEESEARQGTAERSDRNNSFQLDGGVAESIVAVEKVSSKITWN